MPPASAAPAAEPGSAPNVVIVTTDDQEVGSMWMMTNVQAEIGAAGATFANSFTNWPLCCPSRATLITGQFAHNHGVLGTSPPNGGFERLDSTNTLATWLQAAGYATVHVGKYLNGYGESDPRLVPPGWTEWYTGTDKTVQWSYRYTLNENGSLVEYGTAPTDFKQDVITARAVEVINRRVAAPQPLFLVVDYTAPHENHPDPSPQPPADCGQTAIPAPRHAHAFDTAPLASGPSFNEADVSDKPAPVRELPPLAGDAIADLERRHRCRLESLLSVDEGVGQIVDALRGSGELGSTLVVFTSDNGWFNGEHRIAKGKDAVYEEALRVPLLIRGPGIPAGATVRELVVNADIAPTVVEAARATSGRLMDGRSLLAVARDPDRQRGRELLIKAGGVWGIRTWRYLFADYGGEEELYDLRRDPGQLENRHRNPALAVVRAALAERLDALRECAGATCRLRPRVRLTAAPHRSRVRQLQCRGVGARVRGREKEAIRTVTFLLRGRVVARDRKPPFERCLRTGHRRQRTIGANVQLIDGRRVTLERRRHPASARRPGDRTLSSP